MTLRRLALSSLFLVFLAGTFWGQAQQPEIRTGIFRGMKVTYTWVPSKNSLGGGKAIFQGDIILDHVQQLNEKRFGIDSIGVAYSQYLWPKVGSVYEVPYIIDPASGDLTNLNTAIAQFNSNFAGVIQLVARTSETDYVDFNFDPNNMSGSCEAY